MADDTVTEFDPLANKVNKPYDHDDSNIDYDALGQAMDTSWGRSSTPQTSQFSVKFQLNGPTRLVASYASIVNFGSQRQHLEIKMKYRDESERVINAAISAIKKRYKNLSGSALKIKELSSSDSLEVISTTFHSPTRKAYVRRKTVFEIA